MAVLEDSSVDCFNGFWGVLFKGLIIRGEMSHFFKSVQVRKE